MYWWRIRELRAALAAGTLGERAGFLYLLLYVASATLVIELLPFMTSEEAALNRWDAIGAPLYVGMTLAGTVWLYRVNGGRDGAGFVERYLALGWVFGLRFVAASIPVVVGIYAVGWRTDLVSDDTGLFDLIVWTGWSALYWVGLAHHFGAVVAAEPRAAATS